MTMAGEYFWLFVIGGIALACIVVMLLALTFGVDDEEWEAEEW